jgi:hypothetical protein
MTLLALLQLGKFQLRDVCVLCFVFCELQLNIYD